MRGGADYREAHLAMEIIADTKRMASFEITEINPILDEHNKTAQPIKWRYSDPSRRVRGPLSTVTAH